MEVLMRTLAAATTGNLFDFVKLCFGLGTDRQTSRPGRSPHTTNYPAFRRLPLLYTLDGIAHKSSHRRCYSRAISSFQRTYRIRRRVYRGERRQDHSRRNTTRLGDYLH